MKRPGKYIYSYDYKLDENWGEADFTEIDSARISDFMRRADVQAEIAAAVNRINRINSLSEGKLIFTCLADTHYVLNGNWDYTFETIRAVNKGLAKKADGIIHLGDFTDGILSQEVCLDYSHRVLDALKTLETPLYIAVGNHDANYFRKNPEIMDDAKQREMYLDNYAEITEGAENRLYYRSDVPKSNISIIVLSAYCNSEINRYGYDLEQIDWVMNQLDTLPAGRKVLLLSHDAPLTELDFWAREIRNGALLCERLDAWNKANNNRILGMLHGHTHADYIYDKLSFPIISVGCSKIEYFEDKKPDGAIAPARYEDEVSQELWDTLIIDENTGAMDLIRFGAGFDRKYDPEKRYVPQIWAHRGASGYAPENTLEAFALADKMGADGVELDVQFSKDRELVVIHDERVDRTTAKTGFVCDYNVDELVEMGIPTFKSVLELIKPTKMLINIELKTGINLYPGIEKETMDLVKEFGMEDRVIYSSFYHDSVRRVKEYDSNAKCGLLYNIGIMDIADYALQHNMDAVHPGINSMKYPGLIEGCKKNGIKIHTWTVNSEAEMEQMRQYGVDAIITNYPDRARKVYYGENLYQWPADDAEAAAEDVDAAEVPAAELEQIQSAINIKRRQNIVLHGLGTAYKYIRKPFVAVDRFVQRMADK